MIRVGVFGAGGRVGKLIIEDLRQESEISLGAVYVRNELDFSIDPSVLVTNDMNVLLKSSDVIIDFSLPEATQKLLESAMKNPCPLVIGT
ncbi:MAG TPA: 4-hydroxy-tetrahydrodipicolinate reductase, partial [Sulfuricurvum sp.]|nr:4-hydroxy-tetrahydrodipicolinate reductase [Sulfuricurvum sp.]